MSKIPVILSWSGGKDCAYALYQLLQDGRYEVKYLLSTINGNHKRLSMHGIREELIDAQADSIGLPLHKVYVYGATNEEYERQMRAAFEYLHTLQINTVAYGDIFLEDLRAYREETLHLTGMQGLFPLWKKNTLWLINDFVHKGFVSHTCCIHDGYLPKAWAGRKIDRQFIEELPPSVDYCGENGEYHTFCTDGPVFRYPVPFTKGALEYRPLEITLLQNGQVKAETTQGFWFCDFLPNA